MSEITQQEMDRAFAVEAFSTHHKTVVDDLTELSVITEGKERWNAARLAKFAIQALATHRRTTENLSLLHTKITRHQAPTLQAAIVEVHRKFLDITAGALQLRSDAFFVGKLPIGFTRADLMYRLAHVAAAAQAALMELPKKETGQ